MRVLTEAWVPDKFVEFVRDELARRRSDPPEVIFVAEPTDLERCHEIWWGDWDVPFVEFDDDELARHEHGVLYVRRLNDPHSTFNAAMAGGTETC